METGLERKFARFDDDALSVTDGCAIEGYASLFGATDQSDDIVADARGAAKGRACDYRRALDNAGGDRP